MLKFESMNEWMALVDQTPDLKVDDIYSNYTFQPSTPLLPPPLSLTLPPATFLLFDFFFSYSYSYSFCLVSMMINHDLRVYLFVIYVYIVFDHLDNHLVESIDLDPQSLTLPLHLLRIDPLDTPPFFTPCPLGLLCLPRGPLPPLPYLLVTLTK